MGLVTLLTAFVGLCYLIYFILWSFDKYGPLTCCLVVLLCVAILLLLYNCGMLLVRYVSGRNRRSGSESSTASYLPLSRAPGTNVAQAELEVTDELPSYAGLLEEQSNQCTGAAADKLGTATDADPSSLV